MDLHKSNLEETHKNRQNVCPLSILVRAIKILSQQQPVVLEINFLNEFSETKFIPMKFFNPRWIIKRMMKIHAECMKVIFKDPNYLRELVYKYNSSGEKEEEYVFSNNMPFYIDVITICFLCTMEVFQLNDFKLMNDLIIMMRRKYCMIDIKNFDPCIVTISRVLLSYPSVIINLLCLNYLFFPISDILLQWNLTNIFCIPWLALIIPILRFEYKTPLTLLLALAVVLDNENKHTYVLYQRILALYTSEVFPRSFKLALCIKWGIVYKINNEYKFASYFITLREKAINLILSVKINDPSVGYTLSQINEIDEEICAILFVD